MTKSNTKQVEQGTDDLKMRVLKLKKRLPNQYMGKFLRKFPEYNNPSGKNLIYNVVSLRTTDLEVIKNLETIIL